MIKLEIKFKVEGNKDLIKHVKAWTYITKDQCMELLTGLKK